MGEPTSDATKDAIPPAALDEGAKAVALDLRFSLRSDAGRTLLALPAGTAVGPAAWLALELELTGNLGDDAAVARLQRRRSQVRTATVALEAARIDDWVRARADTMARRGFHEVEVVLGDGGVEVHATYRDPREPDGPRIGMRARGGVCLEPSAPDTLWLTIDEVLTEGARPTGLPDALIARALCQAFGALPASDPDYAQAAARLEGVATVRMSPLWLALFHLMPPAGWRMPTLGGARLIDVRMRPGRLELSFGSAAAPAAARTAAATVRERRLMERLAMARKADAAEALLAAGELERAAAAYQAALAESPEQPFLVERALDVLSVLDARHDEARALAEQTLARDPAFRPALASLLRIAQARGDDSETGALLGRLAAAAAEAGDERGAARLSLDAARRLLTGQGTLARGGEAPLIVAALAMLDRVPDGEPDAQALYRRALDLAVEQGDWEAIERAAGRLLARASADPGLEPEPDARPAVELARLLALAADRLGRAGDAVERYQALLDRTDLSPTARHAAWERLAQLSEDAGDPRRAIEVLLEASRDRENGRSHAADRLFRAAELLRKHPGEGGVEQREELLEEALHLEPDHLAALDALETLHSEAGHSERVTVILSRKIAVARAPDRKKSLLVRLAAMQAGLDKPDASRAAYERALELDPRLVAALHALARLDLGAGRLEAARLRYETLLVELRLGNGDPMVGTAGELELEAHVALAEIARRERRPQDEERELLAALALEPRRTDALDALDRHYQAAARWGDLAELLRTRGEHEADPVKRLALVLRRATLMSERLSNSRDAAELLREILSGEPRAGAEVVHLYALDRLAAALGVLGAHGERVEVLDRLVARIGAMSPDAGPLPRAAAALATAAATALLGANDPGKAEALAGRALALDPEEPRANEVLDWLQQFRAGGPGPTDAVAAARAAFENAWSAYQRARGRADDVEAAARALAGLDEAVATREALWFAADLHEHRGDLPRSRRALDELRGRARAAGEPDAELDALRRQASLAERAGASSEPLLGRILDLAPHDEAAVTALAALYKARGDNDRYAAMLERQQGILHRSQAGTEAEVEVLVERTRVGLSRGDLAQAAASADEAMRLAPSDPRAVRLQIDLAMARSEWPEAARGLETLARMVGSRDDGTARARLYAELALLYADRLADRERAALALKHATDADPAAPELLRARAKLAWDDGDHAGVVAALLAIPPAARSRGDHERLAASQLALGRREDALTTLEAGLLAAERADDAGYVRTVVRALHNLDPGHLGAFAAMARAIGSGAELYAYAEELARQLKDAPSRVEIFRELGAIRRDAGDEDGAIYAFQRALEEDPSDSGALFGVIEAAEATGALDHAVAALVRAAEREADPERRRVLDKRRAALELRARPTPMADDAPKPSDADVADEPPATASEDESRAEQRVQALVVEADRERDAERKRGLLVEAADLLERELHELSDAGNLLAQAAALEPVATTLCARARELLVRAGDLSGALAACELEMTATHAAGRVRLRTERASLLGRLGRVVEADGELSAVLAEQPGLGQAHLLLGHLRVADGDRQGALGHLLAAVRSDIAAHDAADAAIVAGEILVETGQPEQARLRYEDALRLDPANGKSAVALERLYRELGDYEALAEVLGRLIMLANSREERARLWFRRGLIYRDVLDREPETYRCLKEAFGNDPNHREIAEALRVVAASRGEWALVAELLTRELATTHAPRERAALEARLGAVLEQKLINAEQALRRYQEAARLDPGHIDARLALARLYGDARRFAEAAATERELAALDSGLEPRAEHLARAGEHEERAGRPVEARALYREASSAVNHRGAAAAIAARGLSRLGGAAGDRGEMREVLLARLADTVDPDERLEIHRKLLEAALATQHELEVRGLASVPAQTVADTDTEIETRARQVLGLDDGDANAFIALKGVFTRRQDHLSLAELLKRRSENASDASERAALRFELGRLFEARLGDTTRAGQAYEMALEDDGRHAAALESLADLAYRARDFERARWLYGRLPEDACSMGLDALRFRRGEIAEKLGASEEAESLYRSAAVVNPSHADALHGLARIARTRNDFAGSAEALRQALDLVPLNDVAGITTLRQQIGELYQKGGNSAEARVFLELVVAEDPERLSALGPLAQLYAQAGAWERAAELFQRMSSLAPAPEKRAELLFRQGEIYLLELHDRERASAAYLKAIDLHPGHVPTLWRLVDYYWLERSAADVIDLAGDLERLGALSGPLDAEIAKRLARLAVAHALVGDAARSRAAARSLAELGKSTGNLAARAVAEALTEAATMTSPERPLDLVARALFPLMSGSADTRAVLGVLHDLAARTGEEGDGARAAEAALKKALGL